MSVTSTVQQQGDRMPMNGHTMRSPLLPPPPPVLQRSNNNNDDPMRTSTTTTTKTTLDGGVSYAQQHLGISLSDGLKKAYDECKSKVERIAGQCRAKNRKFRYVQGFYIHLSPFPCLR